MQTTDKDIVQQAEKAQARGQILAVLEAFLMH